MNVLFRPERLVISQTGEETRRLSSQLIEATKIIVFLMINLILYSAPLTLAGYGVSEDATPPVAFSNIMAPLAADPSRIWQFSIALINNSAFLMVAALLTFGTFHVGIIISGTSKGMLQSLRAVSYSTGIYLAVIFSLVWYLSIAPEIEVADEFLISLQAEFFFYFIDLMQVDLTLPGGRPETVPAARLTSLGLMIMVSILLSTVYFFYVLYNGARAGHGANRIEAFVATLFVMISPAIYVIGIIVFSTII